MTFPILGGNGAVAGYSIDNSLRLNDADGVRLSRTPSSEGNRTTYTYSTWVKRGNLSGVRQHIFGVFIDTNLHTLLRFDPADNLDIRNNFYPNGLSQLDTTAVFRDTSAWYHIVMATDTTQATASDRIKLYVNGVQVSLSGSYPAQNKATYINDDLEHTIGEVSNLGGSEEFDGYLAETHFIDGQALSPTDFGEFDEDSGIWKPIQYTGTYGTNGFYLDFENSGSLGADQSGNGNNFTPTNLASTDQTTDTPTNNFATLSSIDTHTTSPTLAEGNTDFTGVSGTAFTPARSTMAVSSGKWYMEYKFKTAGGGVGVMTTQSPINDHLRDDSDVRSLYRGHSGYYFGRNNSGAIDDVGDNSQTFSADDIGMIALDLDNGYVYFGKNGTWLYGQDGSTTGVPTSGSSGTGSANHFTQLLTNQHDGVWGFMAYDISTSTTGRVIANFGNPPYTPASAVSDANGYGKFEYAPPSGYLALCTQNLATELSPTIDDGSQYFNTVTYTGDGTSSHAITGVGFQPDLVWWKSRGDSQDHQWYDVVRGVTKAIESNKTTAEYTQSNGLLSFDSDGFTVGSGTAGNFNGDTFASWNWKAGGTGVSNTDGSITSTVSANTTAGFSIVTYTGTTDQIETVGHGLGVVPKVMIFKNRDQGTGGNWAVYFEALGNNKKLFLNTTGAEANTGNFNSTTPTSSVFTINTASTEVGQLADTVAYCFAEIEGYSKFGSYTGNGNSTDGTFIYTGHKSQWLLIKNVEQAGGQWFIYDVKRETFNPLNSSLFAESSQAETSNNSALDIDILSNGWKIRNTGSGFNNSGIKYIYMSFASNPFVSSSGVPVVAR